MEDLFHKGPACWQRLCCGVIRDVPESSRLLRIELGVRSLPRVCSRLRLQGQLIVGLAILQPAIVDQPACQESKESWSPASFWAAGGLFMGVLAQLHKVHSATCNLGNKALLGTFAHRCCSAFASLSLPASRRQWHHDADVNADAGQCSMHSHAGVTGQVHMHFSDACNMGLVFAASVVAVGCWRDHVQRDQQLQRTCADGSPSCQGKQRG